MKKLLLLTSLWTAAVQISVARAQTAEDPAFQDSKTVTKEDQAKKEQRARLEGALALLLWVPAIHGTEDRSAFLDIETVDRMLAELQVTPTKDERARIEEGLKRSTEAGPERDRLACRSCIVEMCDLYTTQELRAQAERGSDPKSKDEARGAAETAAQVFFERWVYAHLIEQAVDVAKILRTGDSLESFAQALVETKAFVKFAQESQKKKVTAFFKLFSSTVDPVWEQLRSSAPIIYEISDKDEALQAVNDRFADLSLVVCSTQEVFGPKKNSAGKWQINLFSATEHPWSERHIGVAKAVVRAAIAVLAFPEDKVATSTLSPLQVLFSDGVAVTVFSDIATVEVSSTIEGYLTRLKTEDIRRHRAYSVVHRIRRRFGNNGLQRLVKLIAADAIQEAWLADSTGLENLILEEIRR